MSVATDLQNGTYTIMSYTGAFVELASSQANVTVWNFGNSLQQQVGFQLCLRATHSSSSLYFPKWDVEVIGDGTYTLQNVQYNTYISTTTPTELDSLVQQSSTPFYWSIRLNVTNLPQYV